MRRKVDDFLDSWYQKPKPIRRCLVVQGLRQCGKTFVVSRFLSNKFAGKHAVISLKQDSGFCRKLEGVADCSHLEEVIAFKIAKKLSLTDRFALFVDDVELAPHLSPFFWQLTNRHPGLYVILGCTHPEVGVRASSRFFPVGRYDHYYMGAMDFEEFLWGLGLEEQAAELALVAKGVLSLTGDGIEEASVWAERLSPIHGRLMELLLVYEVVGGMPSAVKVYAENRDIHTVRDAQEKLWTTIEADFTDLIRRKCLSRKVASVLPKVLDNMESFCQRVEYSTIPSVHSETVKKAIKALQQMGVVIVQQYSSAVKRPLATGATPKGHRLFMADTGLWHAFKKTAPNVGKALNVPQGFLVAELTKVLSGASRRNPAYFWKNKNQRDGAVVEALVASSRQTLALNTQKGLSSSSKSLASFKKRFDDKEDSFLRLLCGLCSHEPLGQAKGADIRIPYYLIPFLL